MGTTHIALHLDASSSLRTVTVYQSTAEVIRKVIVELRDGVNIVEIRGLSSNIDTDSLRLHASGAASVRVLESTCRIVPSASFFGPDRKHAATLCSLAAKRSRLISEQSVRQKEVEVLDQAARAVVNGNLGDLNAFMDSFVQRRRAAQKAVLELTEQIKMIHQEAFVLQNSSKGETNAIATLALYVERESSVELQLAYVVNGVSWSPYYDFLAQTADGKTSPEVSLIYCASISQGTGEDWGNATLVLSTASAPNLRNLAIPVLDSIKVSTVTGKPAHPQASSGLLDGGPARTSTTAPAVGGLFMRTANTGPTGGMLGTNHTTMQQMVGPTNFGQHAVSASTTPQSVPGVALHQPLLGSSTNQPWVFGAPSPMQAAPPPMQAAPANTTSFGAFGAQTSDATQAADNETTDSPFENMSISPVAATYRLKDKVSIPSDGFVHKVSIARFDFNAQIEYVSVPRKSAGVFVQARVKNTSEYELLAGPVNVSMNNSLVAKTMLPAVAPNESFDCVLGIDTALKVSYQSVARPVNDPTHIFVPTKDVTRTLTMTVTNGHQCDIKNLVIRDAIPLGNPFSGLSVTLRKPAGLAHAKDGDLAIPVESDAGAEVKARWSKVENGRGGKKAGLYEWVVDLSAEKNVALVAEWDIKAAGALVNEIS
ncbi:hypothetical protein C8Q74DRAFT_1349598 [Fomes fomentarius]|nr:hypothetical protein C8Q74DRAFT_1349598 [Fomes fomentarius]